MEPMTVAPAASQCAASYDEIKPLVELCKAGRLFDVQAWIASGKPVNLPAPVNRRHGKSPLDVAIQLGFHSMVQVLLEGGARIETGGWHDHVTEVLELRRFDLALLLIKHGFDPKSVDMEAVFMTWDPEIMEYFIEHGADVEAGNPLAFALSRRIRTALRIFKQLKDRFPSFQEQANIALRYHCKEGNLKWVSLMLWAGADPYAPGSYDYTEERDSDDPGLSALGWAALYRHPEVFDLRNLRLDPKNPALREAIGYTDGADGLRLLVRLLEMGVDPNDQDNGGCSVIQRFLSGMSWQLPCFDRWGREPARKNIDSSHARDRLKAIHILAKHGAKWIPQDKRELNEARRSLLKLTADYAVEFVWIMSKYNACSRESIDDLIRTPSIKALITKHGPRVAELLSRWQTDDSARGHPAQSQSESRRVSG